MPPPVALVTSGPQSGRKRGPRPAPPMLICALAAAPRADVAAANAAPTRYLHVRFIALLLSFMDRFFDSTIHYAVPRRDVCREPKVMDTRREGEIAAASN